MRTMTHLTLRTSRFALALVLLSTLNSQPSTLLAQGTAFTYQGRLNQGGSVASGNYEFQFTLFETEKGGGGVAQPITTPLIALSNGLFTVQLDFGPNVFAGQPRWLEIAVRTNGNANATTLDPRQPLTATPYALFAAAANLSGTISSAVAFNNPANTFSGSGAGMTGLNASQLTTGTVPDARLSQTVARTNQVWLLGGNAGTTPATQFLGTTDNQPLELRVNRTRALRLEPNGSGAPNVIGGSPVNFVGAGMVGAVIGGGGTTNYFTLAHSNAVLADFGMIGGGSGNRIAANSRYATIAGGAFNDLNTNSWYAAIGGGFNNNIADNSLATTIAGGTRNDIDANASSSAIGGGEGNYVGTNSPNATIAGGRGHLIQADALGAAIGGGTDNVILAGAQNAVIGGGTNNTIGANSIGSAIHGGGENLISSNAPYSSIVGGFGNVIGAGSFQYAFIGGGANNEIRLTSQGAVITGGRDNRIDTGSLGSSVLGGSGNLIGSNVHAGLIVGGAANEIIGGASFHQVPVIVGGSANEIGSGSTYSAILGGRNNHIGTSCAFSLAAGHRSQVNHPGAFVWADNQGDLPGSSFSSAGTNTFNIRAEGGVHLNGDTSQFFGTTTRQMLNLWNTDHGIGVQSLTTYFRTGNGGSFSWFRGGTHSDSANSPGAGGVEMMRLNSTGLRVNGVFVSASDRNVKTNFAEVDVRDVLERVARLPVRTWHFTNDLSVRHLGPVAQDFHTAFGLGEDDKHIATVDADGVALAAIQGLNQKLEQKETEITELKQRLTKLEKFITNLNSKETDP